MNLGVYCETLSPARLSDPAVLGLLGDYAVTLGHALCFQEADRFAPARVMPHLELAAKLRTAGGRYALWPLLPKERGYWINERNLDAADRMIDALLDTFRRQGERPDLLVIDVETPWSQMERVFFPGPSTCRRLISFARFALENRNPRRFAWAVGRLREIVERVRREGIPISSAVFPLLIADLVDDGRALQDYLEMPVFDVGFDAYNAMFYNSYLPQAVPLLIPPEAAPRFLFEYASELRRRFADQAWITLGSTWEGVLPGNEGKVYRAAAQLAPDIAATKAAGVKTIWLYCLEGVLFSDEKLAVRRTRAEAEAFFRTIVDTPASEPSADAHWSRNRSILERLLRDRLNFLYGLT